MFCAHTLPWHSPALRGGVEDWAGQARVGGVLKGHHEEAAQHLARARSG